MARRNCLSLSEKIQIINAQEKDKLSVREVAKRFNIGKTQAAEISKHKDALRAKWQSGSNVNQKKSSLTPQGAQVDTLCYDWFIKARSQNIPISGPIVKAKAKEIAEQIKYSGFSASDGWLDKWRKRHNISFKCKSGEAQSASELSKSVNVLDASNSWDKVEASTIQNCFRKAAFIDLTLDADEFDAEDDLPLSTVEIDSISCTENNNIEIDFENQNDIEEVPSDSDKELNVQTSDSIKSYDDALQHIALLKQFARHDFVAFEQLHNLEGHFVDLQWKWKQANCKQSTIGRFFQPV